MKRINTTQPTPGQLAASCAAQIDALLARRGCAIYGEAQIVRASRLRRWLLQKLGTGHVEVQVKVIPARPSPPVPSAQ